MKNLLILARPKQWSKNLLVFAAYLFTAQLKNQAYIVETLTAFAAMCCLSSATYIVNDWFDRDRDRAHPEKKNRPMASGVVSQTTGLSFAVILALVGAFLGYWLNVVSLAILIAYVALQVLYNAVLKKIPIADVFTIALGFVMRAALGAAAISVGMSGWLLICTASIALMLGFAKRRHEFILQGEDREASRASLGQYNLLSLNAFVGMFATMACVAYTLYCVDSKTGQTYPGLILTAPFVFYGICRYLLIVFTRDEGGEPADLLFKDSSIIISVFGFIVTAVLALSLSRVPIIER